MKKIFILAVAVLALASCKKEQEMIVEAPETKAAEMAMDFDVYTSRGVETRAGYVGEVKTADLKSATSDLGKAGFGVFAYYTDNNTYDPQSIPNFMYNQQVKYDGTAFTYTPVKYWPNEYGNAVADDNDKVSFFAYAPYVKVVPSTGKLETSTTGPDPDAQWGITAMSRNSANGDPIIKYIASFDASKCVDLCWGVVGEESETWSIIEPSYSQHLNVGEPWVDICRPASVEQRMKFTFKHALAQLNVQIDAFVDDYAPTTSALAAETKIYVREVTFSGFATKGALNLNNREAGPNKAYWLDYNGTTDLQADEDVTIYDGRKDGKEGTLGAVAANEKSLGLNSSIISNDGNTTTGVTETAVNLFTATTADAPILIIPTGETINVTIVYDVETADENLATYLSDGKTPGSRIKNVIRRESVAFGGGNVFENGKSYTLKLHLGLNSVKIDAAVTDWVEAPADIDIDLPSNLPAFTADATPSPVTVKLPFDVTSYKFEIRGLDGGEHVTSALGGADVGTLHLTAATSVDANASGVAVEEISLNENETVWTVTPTATTWTGDASGKGVSIIFQQAPHVLNLEAAGTAGNTAITLTSGSATMTWATDVPAAGINNEETSRLMVWKNGVKQVYDASAADVANKFTFSGGTITLGEAAAAGDKYTIMVKAGDAPAETVTIVIS